MAEIDRVILIVMDSVGIGYAQDAKLFDDEGANTLGNIAKWAKIHKLQPRLPKLCELGLARLLPDDFESGRCVGASARLVEVSAGKDTTSGHWEIAGTPQTQAFSFFYEGFPQDLLDEICSRAGVEGILGNKMASGTGIIDELAEEHIQSGRPILYTSMDSVFQVAAHEKHFGLDKLYRFCEIARELTLKLRVGRVIARPFVGEAGAYKRVAEHRKDYSLEAPSPNLLDILYSHTRVVSVGKIDDIFCHRSLHVKRHTGNNESSAKALIELLGDPALRHSFIFANFIDFDQEWGHRRDPAGYLSCLETFDQFLSKLLSCLTGRDLLLITADHGNDPTFRGTDHTRENVPLLIFSPNPSFIAANLGENVGYFHIAKLVLESLGLGEECEKMLPVKDARSFWNEVWRHA